MSQPIVDIELDIPRPVAEVHAWWTQAPEDYRASDPREQPHRIVTKRRDEREWVIDTYWRAGVFRDLRVPETFTFRPDGWRVDITLPTGIAQRDEFTLTPTPEGTRVRIQAWVRARHAGGWLTAPFYRAYGRRNFPRWWRTAAKLCARDAPRLS